MIFETNQQEQLIKHAISTVVVSKPFHEPMHTNPASAASHCVPGVPVGDDDN